MDQNINIYYIGDESFFQSSFKLKDNKHFSFIADPDTLLHKNLNSAIVFVDIRLQDYIAENCIPSFELSDTIVVLTHNKPIESKIQVKALKQGYFEIIENNISEDELECLLIKYGKIINRTNPTLKKSTIQQVLDASPAAVRIVDFNHKVIYSNAKYAELNKANFDEIIGSECKNYFCAWFCDSNKCAIKTMKNTQKPFEFEHVHINKLGKREYYLFEVKPFKNQQGETIGIIESIIDVSYSKESENAYLQSEAKFKTYVESSPLAIFIANKQGYYTYVNIAATKLVGYSRQALNKMNIFDLTDEHELAKASFTELINKGHASCEIKLKTKDNQQIPVLLKGAFLSDNDYIAYVTDISKLKDTEQKLNEYQLKLEDLVKRRTKEVENKEKSLQVYYKVAHEGSWDINYAANTTYFSSTFYTLLGYDPFEFPAKFEMWLDMIHPDDKETFKNQLESFKSNNKKEFNFELRIKQKNEQYKWVKCHGIGLLIAKNGEKKRIGGSIIEINYEKDTMITQANTEEKHKALVEQVNDWIWEVDTNGVYTYSSPLVFQILGYYSEELLSKRPFDLMPEKEAAKMKTIFCKDNLLNKSFIETDSKFIHKKGYEVYLETRGVAVYNELGTIVGVKGVSRDVTKRVFVQKSIKENEEKFRKIFDTTKDLIFITDKNGIILDINKSAQTLFNLEQESPNIKIVGLFCSKVLTSFIKHFNPNELNVAEIPLNKKNKVFELNSCKIPFKGKERVLHVFKEVTARKKLERKVLQTIIETEEKERSRFARDLHDGLGPQLSAIKLYINSLGLSAYDESKKQKMITNAKSIIDTAILSTKEIANNLMPSILENFGLVDAVKRFSNSIKDNNINVNVINHYFNESLPQKHLVTLYRVICELINNTVKHAKAKNITIELKSNKEQNTIKYSDDGIGFDFDKLKASGRGVDNIKNRIKSLNGQLKFNTKPGKGTHVNIKMKNSDLYE